MIKRLNTTEYISMIRRYLIRFCNQLSILIVYMQQLLIAQMTASFLQQITQLSSFPFTPDKQLGL